MLMFMHVTIGDNYWLLNGATKPGDSKPFK